MIRVLSREPDSSMLGLMTNSQNMISLENSAGRNILLQGGSQGSNPAIVALEGAAKNQLLSHDE